MLDNKYFFSILVGNNNLLLTAINLSHSDSWSNFVIFTGQGTGSPFILAQTKLVVGTAGFTCQLLSSLKN
jgi:hypothetical protein